MRANSKLDEFQYITIQPKKIELNMSIWNNYWQSLWAEARAKINCVRLDFLCQNWSNVRYNVHTAFNRTGWNICNNFSDKESKYC